MSFTVERSFLHSLALIVGVAVRGDAGALAPVVRPVGANPDPMGHFHAAAFSFRPLPRGDLELKPTVATLFEAQACKASST